MTRDEADVLFDIAHATSQADPSFDDLFARAIGNYLMAINLHVPDAAEALHFEKWLDDKEDLLGFVSRMFHRAPAANSFDVLASPAQAFEADLAQQDVADEALLDARKNISDAAAAWLIAHLTHDGELSSAEKRLLQFLGAEARAMAAPLRALIDKANAVSLSSRRA